MTVLEVLSLRAELQARRGNPIIDLDCFAHLQHKLASGQVAYTPRNDVLSVIASVSMAISVLFTALYI